MSTTLRTSAGALPWRRGRDNTPEVLLVHRRKYGDWAIPKGNAQPTESAAECARRELGEETGFECNLDWPLPCLRYLTPSLQPKTAHYWAATRTAGWFRADEEVDRIRWFGVPEAVTVISKPRERAILLALAAWLQHERGLTAARRRRAVLLIRGAPATPRELWPHTDETRPLAEAGRSTALSLLTLATAFEVGLVLSAPTRRCIETIAPLAHSQSIPVQASDGLRDGHLRDALEIIDQARDTSTVVCTHEDIVMGLLRRLVERDHTRIDDRFGVRRGSAWALTSNHARYTRAYYIPMPE